MELKHMVAIPVPFGNWSVLGNDTTGLNLVESGPDEKATLKFNKANGAANTVFAGVKNSSLSIPTYQLSMFDWIAWGIGCPDVTNVAYSFLRLGTSATDYCEYRYADSSLVDGGWTLCRKLIGEPSSVTGKGLFGSTVTYIEAGLAFDAETNTLTGIGLSRVFTLEAEFNA